MYSTSADWALRKPITGIFGCCARAASGHATALTSTAMNFRRRIGHASDLGYGQQPTATTGTREQGASASGRNSFDVLLRRGDHAAAPSPAMNSPPSHQSCLQAAAQTAAYRDHGYRVWPWGEIPSISFCGAGAKLQSELLVAIRNP
jgi:hypothetical protein